MSEYEQSSQAQRDGLAETKQSKQYKSMKKVKQQKSKHFKFKQLDVSSEDEDQHKNQRKTQQNEMIQVQPNQAWDNNILRFVLSIILIGSFVFIFAIQVDKSQYKRSIQPVNLRNIQKIALVFMALGDEQQVQKSILSFIQKNTYPITQTIIGIPISFNKNTISKYINKDAVWVRFEKQEPTVAQIDSILRQLNTQYYIYLNSNWIFKQDGYIKYCITILKEFPNLLQVIVTHKQNKQLDQLNNNMFSPAVRRIKNYRSIRGGYSAIVGGFKQYLNTKNSQKISNYYQRKGLTTVFTTKQYYSQAHELQNTYNTNINKHDTQQDFIEDKKYQGMPQNVIQLLKKVNTQSKIKQDQQYEKEVTLHSSQNITKQQMQRMINWQRSLDKTKMDQNKDNKVQQQLFFISNITKLQERQKITNLQLIENYKELPFCFIIIGNSTQIIQQSIETQNYHNYKVIIGNLYQGNNQSLKFNYYFYKNKINQKCIENSIIMFLNSPLKFGSLSYLNRIYQQYRIWATFSKTGNFIQIYSFYYRIYELLQINDFNNTNKKYLDSNNQQYQALGILQLCEKFSAQILKEKITNINMDSHLYYQQDKITYKNRTPYIKLIRLSQDTPLKLQYSEARVENTKKLVPNPGYVSYHHMKQALERQDIWYLPENHSITTIQFAEFNKSYQIQNYLDKQKQVPLCVTVLSHDNIQNDRYLKFAKSLIGQIYQNYRIIFFDDFSNDRTLQMTKKFFQSKNFPKNRITYVKNLKRTFATFNIINAAYNFCEQNQIQLLLDGDDELIGRYAFHVMNAAYQLNQNLWVAYSNYKSNYFQFGRSRGIMYETDILIKGRRQFKSVMGPIRTWKVQLLYNIPIQYHKTMKNQWLDTVYDDALQHCLFQLAGVEKIRYVNEILYEYNRKYGGNDDSTQQKQIYRASVYKDVLWMPSLSRITTLQNSMKNPQVYIELSEGKDIIYTVIQS